MFKAKLSTQKLIEDFDFFFQPYCNKRIIDECSTCQFVTAIRSIVFTGNLDTGKTI